MLLESITFAALGLMSPTPTAAPETSPLLSNTHLAAVERIKEKTEPTPTIPSNAVLEKNGAIIGEITFLVKDVFDTNNPRESGGFYRLVNKLHINTQPSTVRDLLLFKTGDAFTALSMQESERILRGQRFIFDARIQPIAYSNNIVDIEVITTDVWTLGISIHASREGGQNRSSYELRDSNILGSGKELRIQRSNNVDRTEKIFGYHDPNTASNHGELDIEYSDNSDGLNKYVNMKRPFISLETTWSYNAIYNHNERTDSVYTNGIISDYFHHHTELYEFSLGYSAGIVNNKAKRWTFGFTNSTDLYTPNNQTIDIGDLPNDTKLVYPWLSFDYIENKYIKTKRVNFINRPEDLNLGESYTIKLGWSDKDLHAYTNSLLYETHYQTSYKPTSNQLYLSEFHLTGRMTEGHTDNISINAITKYYYPFLPNQIFHYKLDMEVARGSDSTNQIMLGGDTGLRGYPIRVQEGDRKVLFSLEHRFYTEWHILQMVYVGGALFFDIGRAWSDDTPNGPNDGVLKDVGFGLRLSSSRASKGKVLHVDFAFPMDGDEMVDKYQFNVITKASF